jgi:hypothetical protein
MTLVRTVLLPVLLAMLLLSPVWALADAVEAAAPLVPPGLL